MLLTHLTTEKSTADWEKGEGYIALSKNEFARKYADLIVGGHWHKVFPEYKNGKKYVYDSKSDCVPISFWYEARRNSNKLEYHFTNLYLIMQ